MRQKQAKKTRLHVLRTNSFGDLRKKNLHIFCHSRTHDSNKELIQITNYSSRMQTSGCFHALLRQTDWTGRSNVAVKKVWRSFLWFETWQQLMVRLNTIFFLMYEKCLLISNILQYLSNISILEHNIKMYTAKWMDRRR